MMSVAQEAYLRALRAGPPPCHRRGRGMFKEALHNQKGKQNARTPIQHTHGQKQHAKTQLCSGMIRHVHFHYRQTMIVLLLDQKTNEIWDNPLVSFFP